MVRLNKHSLTEKQISQLFEQFARLVSAKSSYVTVPILQEILGKEEQIMVAKRLAVIVLILEKKSLYSISRSLKLSPATAQRIKENLDTGQYDTIVKQLQTSKRNYFAILDTLDSILHLGGILPHYSGPDRRHRKR